MKLAVEHTGGDRGFVAFSQGGGRLEVVAQHGLGRDRARRILATIEGVSAYRVNDSGPLVVWPRMMEFQVSEGSVGDIWVIKGTSIIVRGDKYDSTPDHPYIRIPRIGRGELQNVTGFRQPQGEVENPQGQWNVLELVADHDRVMQFVNGKLVNEGTNANTTRGKIDFQSEGAEVYFRNMKIADLK